MSEHLLVTASPHIRSYVSTQKVMATVIVALLPALFAATYYFGFRALLLAAVCVAASVLSEYLIRKVVMKKDNTVSDLSAAVTGLLLALNLPATMPLWMAAIGCVFAIVVVKQLFGGLGQNFVNPAIVGRIFLVVSFTSQMTHWVQPQTDAVASATPLVQLAQKSPDLPSLWNMFIGNRAGSMGETCILALLIGGVFLMVIRVIKPTIPLVYMGTVYVLATLFGADGLYHLLSGGLVLGAFFMATDYTTSPTTTKGKVIYAVGLGFFTVLIRIFGSYPEGVSFAILLMNIVTPYIDRFTKSVPFGGVAVAKK